MYEYLLVDGYNIIFAWEELCQIANDNLENARVKLLNIMSNFAGLTQCEVIVIFDAHKVRGGIGSVEQFYNIKVVYTKEAETADNYIERATHTLAKKYKVRVATSDFLEQIIIMGRGAQRVSARELLFEIENANKSLREN